ncbi:hypothetical protein [Neolewinella agarilytica]|uniref:Uncharacterized protein n=1 Tax=Neolewinella agarilytica TaxID=478744 RepID=A0A1H8ZD93_9BACT|nr:hypothetical protein [Neolewinella agarilytica]SEP62137.1 hypothetical protein SAMN05444359_101270 [Neolewinella agarilytica]
MSLLQQTILALSVHERRRAVSWLNCELHNRREDVRLLFKLRSEQEQTATPQAEYKAVYGEADYDADRFRQLEHQLLKRLEAYLAWEHYQRDTVSPDRHLLLSLRDRGLDDHRRTRLRRYRPRQPNGTDRLSFEYFHAREQYEMELAASRGGRVDYLGPEKALEHYVIALRLRQTCKTLAHQQLHKSGQHYEIPRLEALFAAANQKPFREAPFIRLYYLVTRLQLDEAEAAESSFQELIRLLESSGASLPAEDQRDLLLLAINYGLRRANTGWEPAIAATFTLYRLGLDREILYNRGRISLFAFNNILGLALRLKEVEWATRFMDTEAARLPEKGGSEVLALGRARLALANNQDGEALHHLQQADFKDFIHHLTARVLQLKIYFRQDSYTLLQSHISSTRKLLTRRRGIGYHLQNYRNIFALANAVLRLGPGDDKAAEQLRQRIIRMDPCTEKPWLLSVLKGS